MKDFINFKNQVLKAKDRSIKGDIDLEIRALIDKINAEPNYVTLSSCSGRSSVIIDASEKQKKGCKWVYTTHADIDENELVEKVETALSENLVLKFEPFILHVGCSSLEDAKRMLTSALECGFRNSGLVIGRHNKITLAVRSTLNLEAPISYEGKLIDREHLTFLIRRANDKMKINFAQIKKIETTLTALFDTADSKMTDPGGG